jgi:hypothetical protein
VGHRWSFGAVIDIHRTVRVDFESFALTADTWELLDRTIMRELDTAPYILQESTGLLL